MNRKINKSFYEWCIENNRQNELDRWDYELSKCNPEDINYGTHKKYYFKCPCHKHESELKNIGSFTAGQEGSMKCNACNSFPQWGIDNICSDFLDKYWDYEKNPDINPWKINHGSKQKIWIRCLEDTVHGSYQIICKDFVNGHRCPYCHGTQTHPKDSFAQHHVSHTDKDFLKKYWDYDKNVGIDPWDISPHSMKKIWIICQKRDYHGSYKICCNDFTNSRRCSYCGNFKVHSLDSLGTLSPEVFAVWSDKNKKSPYECTPKSNQIVFWKCPDGKHKDFKRSIKISQVCDFRCPDCQFSKGEKRIEEWLDLHNLDYIPQKEFDGLLGLGDGNLSYDFYLPTHNFLIEYDGEYHYAPIKRCKNEPMKYAEERFAKQKVHDKLKTEYATDNNIKLLRVPYWDFDNIERILENKIK